MYDAVLCYSFEFPPLQVKWGEDDRMFVLLCHGFESIALRCPLSTSNGGGCNECSGGGQTDGYDMCMANNYAKDSDMTYFPQIPSGRSKRFFDHDYSNLHHSHCLSVACILSCCCCPLIPPHARGSCGNFLFPTHSCCSI